MDGGHEDSTGGTQVPQMTLDDLEFANCISLQCIAKQQSILVDDAPSSRQSISVNVHIGAVAAVVAE